MTAPNHEFLPVAGHPDDDECTHREDGTDSTYCGLPESQHNTATVSDESTKHEYRWNERSKPTSDTGIYLHRHTHDWFEIGLNRWPVGTWHPVFQCLVCGDVICDLNVTRPNPTSLPRSG